MVKVLKKELMLSSSRLEFCWLKGRLIEKITDLGCRKELILMVINY